jgi:hypothetical protein
MIIYEITALVDAGQVGAYERFMREHHIPDLLATGCFSRATLARSSPGRYRAGFEARDEADLERYLVDHAPRLRQDFASRFSAGVTLSREVWTVVGAGPEASPGLSLEVLPDTLSVCRLDARATIPGWAERANGFLTLSRTADELSITAVQAAVPEGLSCEHDYRALRVSGRLPHHLVGILASIAGPLAAARISIFAISTHDTDYVLVKATDLDAAVQTLERAGHRVIG